MTARILLTGANGMLGTSIREAWAAHPPADAELLPVTRTDVDLSDAAATSAFVRDVAPSHVIHAAAKVGGIAANVAAPADFLMQNLAVDTAVFSAALAAGVERLVYISSANVYPVTLEEGIDETRMLTGPLHPQTEAYSLAKIVGTRTCEYVSRQHGLQWKVILPSNLYGPHDHFDLETAHLVPAAIAKMHAAVERGEQEVILWGDGTARREFTYAPDVATWLVAALDTLDGWPAMMNLGAGNDHSILDYYTTAGEVVGYRGVITPDPSKPSGARRKLLDSTLARQHGWAPSTTLEDGMRAVYAAYLASDH